MEVPKVTHQIWFQGWDTIPEEYSGYVESIAILNPKWDHKKWDDQTLRAECAKFSPEAAAKYDSYMHMIQKVDFGRYVVLYNYGGVSIDADAECLRPLEKIPGIDRWDLLVCKSATTRLENFLITTGKFDDLTMLNNAMIACSKNNPLMKQFIEFVIEIDNDEPEEISQILMTTGPLALTIFFNHFLDEICILDSEIAEPLRAVTHRTVINHISSTRWVPGFARYFLAWYKTLRPYFFTLALVIFVLLILLRGRR